MKELDHKDTSLLMAMATDSSGRWDSEIVPRLSRSARPVAVALRRGGKGRGDVANRAAAILRSVNSNRKAVEQRLKSGA